MSDNDQQLLAFIDEIELKKATLEQQILDISAPQKNLMRQNNAVKNTFYLIYIKISALWTA